MQETRRYIAPAKINLGLEVLYQRPDGYHELNTCFMRVLEPHDSLAVTASEFFHVSCSDPSLPVDKSNLVIKAAKAFEAMTSEALPNIHVHLEKHIPTGAGLGGGSSDAATMLQVLSDYSASAPPFDTLMSLAAKLGADVPFFLSGDKMAQAGGIGEVLTAIDIDLPLTMLIVVDPSIQVSTKDAYASLSPNPSRSEIDFVEFFDDPPPLAQWKENLCNDFEPEIFRRIPKLAALKHSMYARSAQFALMSGSGSSIYGLFEDGDAANQAKLKFESEGLLAFLS